MSTESTNHVLTVVSPAGCITRINGELTDKIEISENTRIEISVIKTGYKTFEKVIDNLVEDTTINVDDLELLKHKLKIITEPEYNVIINDENIREIEVDEFTPININIKYDGYQSVSQSFEKITEDKEINIQLEKIYHTINVTYPEGTTCSVNPIIIAKVDDINRKAEIVVDEFTPVNIVISKPGYKTITKYYQSVKEDDNINIDVMEYETFDLNVKAGKNCKNAILTINDETAIFGKEYEIGTLGTEVTVKVEKEHYITYLETLTITENTNITVNLEPKTYSVSVENIPEDANIVYHINAQKDKSYTETFKVQSGSKVVITATKPTYKDFIYTIDKIEKDYAIRIPEMELQKFNFTINAPKNSNIVLNGTETEIFPQVFDYGTKLNYIVSKNNYQTESNTIILTEDTVIDVNLELNKYTLTVTTEPSDSTVSITRGSEQFDNREIEVNYGDELTVTVNKEGYQSVTDMFTVIDNTTKNYVLSKKQVKLTFVTTPIELLTGALIKVNDSQINGFETNVNYGESYNITVEKPGFKTFETTIEPIKDSVILVGNNGIWTKPAVSVSIKNIDELQSTPFIKINGKPIGNNVSIPVDYNSNIKVEVESDGYFTINEEYQITDDLTLNYELIDINSGKNKLSVSTELENAEIKINRVKRNLYYAEPGEKIKVEISHNGYETITDEFVISEDTEKYYTLDMFTKKIFKCVFHVNPSTAQVYVDNELIKSKVLNLPYLSVVKYNIFADGYLPKFGEETINGITNISVKLNIDPNFKHEGEQDIYGDGIDGIINMIKFNNCYTYLNIGRYFNNGLIEENIYKFYKEFGYYANSKYDYMLWRKMHAYFGHIDGIKEPEKDN